MTSDQVQFKRSCFVLNDNFTLSKADSNLEGAASDLHSRDTVSTARKKISSLRSQRVKNKGQEVSARYQQAPCRTNMPWLQVLRVLVSVVIQLSQTE